MSVSKNNEILIAEDEPLSRHLLKSTLEKWGYQVWAVENGKQAWDILQEKEAPELVILDWMMPKMDGPEICQKLREQNPDHYTYILLLTAKGQQEDIICGLESGADDYVSKPFNAHELKVRLRAGRRILDLQCQLLQAQAKLRDQATHDALTGLWNREAILDKLQKEIERAKRDQRSLGLVMADLDFFKKINDHYGHLMGDEVLREASRRFQNVVRPYDSVGRYGGEEFLILLPGCDLESASAHAERLLTSLRSHPVTTTDRSLEITGSFGVSSSQLFQKTVSLFCADGLIRSADVALYQAKAAGRNQVVLALSPDPEHSNLKLTSQTVPHYSEKPIGPNSML